MEKTTALLTQKESRDLRKILEEHGIKYEYITGASVDHLEIDWMSKEQFKCIWMELKI